ncbi:hypothetical protein TWF192_009712 [Orbilia oligospora]|uniref:F-box domain-containing protein n=1 Tax=Orbilia oligospora TaxID=2813651 RepID=A0A6G1MK60_ORBOL|nr:hypothetical protein TWF191_010337 [Orbilia oligospora]KAF3260428.1 hypothetical protein TWF192_009712 [Orbilia oligospora]
MSSLLTTPAEITDQILGYLYKHDIGNFSLCSKACRKVALPSLFAGLDLTPESAAAFGDGAVFSSLRPDVRKLYLQGKVYSGFGQEGNEDTVAYVETFRFCVESIRLFPSVRNIYIEYGSYLWENLCVALWREVSMLPNLKEVGRKVIPVGFYRGQYWKSYGDVYPHLSPITQSFVGSEEVHHDDEGVETSSKDSVRVPAGLEVIRLYSRNTLLTRDEEPYFQGFPIKHSIESLRELHITAATINIESGPGTLIFPNVVKLSIDGHESSYIHHWVFQWVSRHCPNVRSLSMIKDTGYYPFYAPPYFSPQDESPYFLMPKLVTLSLQWFLENPIPGAGPTQPPKKFKRRRLEALVREFMDQGMVGLKEVKFFRRPAFGSPDHIIEGGCRISKDEGSGGKIRVWWKKPFYIMLGQKRFEEEEELGESVEGVDSDADDDLDENFPCIMY